MNRPAFPGRGEWLRLGDLIIAAGLLVLLGVSWWRTGFGLWSVTGRLIEVMDGFGTVTRYSLDHQAEYEFYGPDGQYNRVTVASGRVAITAASCPDQICVHTPAVSRAGQYLICLPNRLLIRVIGDGEDWDTVL
ncbi:MAG: NusG domain II-containing protein [Negativicutes bacterium]|nr:NusG domain II-containing protein [Negativicutes bacterium]